MHSERCPGVARLGAEAQERGVRPHAGAHVLRRHAAQELEGAAQQPGRQAAGGGRLAGLQRQVEGQSIRLHACGQSARSISLYDQLCRAQTVTWYMQSGHVQSTLLWQPVWRCRHHIKQRQTVAECARCVRVH